MEKLILKKYLAFNTSKFINLLAICITSFLMVLSSDALLFNPFILSTIWFFFRLSSLYRNTYLLSSVCFATMINVNYGIEILLVIIFLTLSNYLLFYLKKDNSYFIYLPLIILLVLISLRYLSFNFSLPVIFNSTINILLSLIFAITFEKVRFSYINFSTQIENIYKIIFYSFFFSVCIYVDVINLLSIALFSFFLLKYEKKENLIGALFLLLIYNYFFFNISIEVIMTYTLFILFSIIIPKASIIIFVILISFYHIISNQYFYKDINFYLNFLLISYYYLLPNQLPLSLYSIVQNKNDETNKLTKLLSKQNNKMENIKEYLSLALKDPFDEKNIEEELILNVNQNICFSCQKKDLCKTNKVLDQYLKIGITKKEKQDILTECYYPYKLLKRVEVARKNYNFQALSISEKTFEREVFNSQLKVVLSALEDQNNVKDYPNKFNLEYQVYTSSVNYENGDNHIFIEDNNQTLMLLSDGMGHNKLSYQTSSYLINLFIHAYKLNKDINQVLQNINLLLKVKSTSENFATIDLAKFDLYQGRLSLYKAGSFSTFLIREGKMIVFNKISPPLGILDKLEIYKEEYDLMNNDIFIFLSDGFGDDVTVTIEKSISLSDKNSFEKYSKKLFDSLMKEKVNDDKTLIVIKVNLI